MRMSDWSSAVCSSDLDIIANNLANVNTGSYKREDLAFVEYLVRPDKEGNPTFTRPDGRERKRGGWGTSVYVRVDLGGGRIIKKNIEHGIQRCDRLLLTTSLKLV